MPLGFNSIELFAQCIIGLIIVGTVFWVWMLVNCAMNKRISDTQKTVWILIIIFTHLIGALLYLFLGRSAQKAQTPYQPYVQPQTPLPPQVPYYPYQQGYQAAQPPPPYQPGAVPPAPYEQYPPLDYEQPQAMYPHEQNNNE